MRTIIALNGEKFDFEFSKDDKIICCDGAYEHLFAIGVVPDVVLGDFDSLGYVPEGAKVFPAEKDDTDGELALSYALETLGSDNVVFIYAGGKREDHFLGNLAILIKAFNAGIDCRAVTRFSEVYYIDRPRLFSAFVGATVSVVPVMETFIRTSDGLKYAYDNTKMNVASTLGISNIATKSEFFIDVVDGGAFVFINKMKD